MRLPEAGGTQPPNGDLPLEVRQRMYSQVLLGVPAVAVVPVAIALILAATLTPILPGAAALGAAGWLAAMVLRAPASVFIHQKPGQKALRELTSLSGPTEEPIRLLLVLFLVKGFGGALWAGFGWASIEVVYLLAEALLTRRLLIDPSEGAAEGRRLLVSLGLLRNVPPLVGVIERAGVSLLHIGFTLLLSWNPWLVLVTTPVHSATDLCAMRLIRRSAILAETIVVLVGAVAFVLGLLAWHR